MLLPKFTRLAPGSIQEALKLYADLNDSARLFAGGTDLLVRMRAGSIKPAYLIDLKDIADLRGIEYSPAAGLTIGALTTFHELETSPVLRSRYAGLIDGMSRVGSPQIRNRATVGGNICNAAPSADSVPGLLVYGAELVIEGPAGKRAVPLAEFFTGPGKTVLTRGEILTQIKLPVPAPGSGAAYQKFTRRKAMDLALLGAAVYLESRGGTCGLARIALATAAPTPIRARQAEAYLTGRELTPETFRQAGVIAAQEASPRSSFRATESYRRAVLKILVARTAAMAAARITAGG